MPRTTDNLTVHTVIIGNAEIQDWTDYDCGTLTVFYSGSVPILNHEKAPQEFNLGGDNYVCIPHDAESEETMWESGKVDNFSWHEFTCALDLDSFFRPEHDDIHLPWIVGVDRPHLEEVEAKLACLHLDKADNTPINRAIAEWLIYWLRWALDNCEHPAIMWGVTP